MDMNITGMVTIRAESGPIISQEAFPFRYTSRYIVKLKQEWDKINSYKSSAMRKSDHSRARIPGEKQLITALEGD